MLKNIDSSGIRDNWNCGNVGDFLKENISKDALLAFVSAFFTINVYDALKEDLESAKILRFLFGEPMFLRSLSLEQNESRKFALNESGLSISNQLSQFQTP